MSLKVTFELEDKDLRYFRNNMKQAQTAATKLSDEEILTQASAMVDEVKAAKVPLFVQQRVATLDSLVDMVRDPEWDLAPQERKNVLAALAYFADPQDMIPDNIPVLGFIDDAIMIELVVTELKHELEAFNDFCRYRSEEKARNRNQDLSREEYLGIKRRELHARMRRRRSSSRSRSRSSRTRIRLF
jgi:uncharacterized membrane protein YkvA (DUF1232 family)